MRNADKLRNPASLGSAAPDQSRRGSVFGSLNRDVSLHLYAQAWRQKLERNGNLNYAQSSKDSAQSNPVVSVIIRSDGSVEDVVFHHSSGRLDLDNAVRRIIRLNTPFAAFPANIAAKYDVIEIRRVWHFEQTLKIIEEVQ